LLVTHDAAVAAAGDRVVRMRDGRVDTAAIAVTGSQGA
jgi:predicted ABC-type transport system involved in lysophospholipase L1 biosynthesis ATPase subunit